jgi:hypothetical protein
MTLCVAAQCWDNNESKIVYGTDLLSDSGIAKADIEGKAFSVSKEEHVVLVSGSPSRAREIMTILNDLWETSEAAHFINVCREALRRHKHDVADEYVSSQLGISYDKLLTEAYSGLPPDKYREIMDAVTECKPGCELVIGHFESSETSYLFRTNEYGILEACSNFAAVGSGMYMAEASLFQREHSEHDSLPDTIYHVFEAMKTGSRAPGVGEKTIMGVVSY